MESERYHSLIVRQAKEDILQILNYVSENLKNPEAAQNLLKDILHIVDVIATFPYSMAKLKNDKVTLGNEYRRAEVKNFVLIYKIVEATKEIRIMAVFYGASDVSSRFFDRLN